MNPPAQEPGTVTTLGGTLIRWGPNVWAWNDHTPAPEVGDITPSQWFNFRVRRHADSQFVEVPVGRAKSEPELAWCQHGGFEQAMSGDHSGQAILHPDGRMTRGYADPVTGKTTGARAIPMVYLVPAETWDAWSAQFCIGAIWDKKDEPAIFAKATKLGWSGPH